MLEQPPDPSERLKDDYEAGRRPDRRGPDRRKGPRREEDRKLSPKERLLLNGMLVFAALGLGFLIYGATTYFMLQGQPAPSNGPSSGMVNLSNVVNPFTPLDDTVYRVQLCPKLMLDETEDMRMYGSIKQFDRCVSHQAIHKRLAEECDVQTVAVLKPNTQVQTRGCDHLGAHQSHWCEVTVQEGAAEGKTGFVPWECFAPND